MADNPERTGREGRARNEARAREDAVKIMSEFENWLGRAYGKAELDPVEKTRLLEAFAAGRKAGIAAGILSALSAP